SGELVSPRWNRQRSPRLRPPQVPSRSSHRASSRSSALAAASIAENRARAEASPSPAGLANRAITLSRQDAGVARVFDRPEPSNIHRRSHDKAASTLTGYTIQQHSGATSPALAPPAVARHARQTRRS